MKHYCPTCGMEMTFYYQNQRWYCQGCQRYAEPIQAQQTYQQPQHYQAQQAYQQPPQYHQPPAYQSPPQYHQSPMQPTQPLVGKDHARAKIVQSVGMRESTDEIISPRWALLILAFQIVVPILTVAMLFLLVGGTTLNLSVPAQMALIVLIFAAAVAMVIVQSILVYKLVKRRDEHFRRDSMLKQGILEYLSAVSYQGGRDINVEIWTMNSILYSNAEADRSPALWALLVGLVVIIPIIGIFAIIYCLHFLTNDTHSHDREQRNFNHQFQTGMVKLGKQATISYDWAQMPRRDSAVYIVLTILTLGYFLPYWWYVNIVDMNAHMQNQWAFEDRLMEVIRESPPPEKEVDFRNEVPPGS